MLAPEDENRIVNQMLIFSVSFHRLDCEAHALKYNDKFVFVFVFFTAFFFFFTAFFFTAMLIFSVRIVPSSSLDCEAHAG